MIGGTSQYSKFPIWGLTPWTNVILNTTGSQKVIMPDIGNIANKPVSPYFIWHPADATIRATDLDAGIAASFISNTNMTITVPNTTVTQ